MAVSMLTPEQRHAAGALLAIALRHAQVLQTTNDVAELSGGGDDASNLWTHESYGLLRPVFRFLEIDPHAWSDLEESAGLSLDKHKITEECFSKEVHFKQLIQFLRVIFNEDNGASSERVDQKIDLTKAVETMEESLGNASASVEKSRKEHLHEQESCIESSSAATDENPEATCEYKQNLFRKENPVCKSNGISDEIVMPGDVPVNSQQKVALLFELLSACLADSPQDNKESPRRRNGYDARHRVTLRLLATWLDFKWIKMEAMERMVAWSAVAAENEVLQSEESGLEECRWSKWKRGGIIGAAAVTGGTLMAITGGLAAPAIAAGFSALAPTLGTLVPVIGASGFTAAATAAGSAAGSVAVAASLGAAGAGLTGSKMARRIGSIEEFEFRPIEENQEVGLTSYKEAKDSLGFLKSQEPYKSPMDVLSFQRLAVGIFVSGFVFEEDDFVKPWKGERTNLERYALQWESKNLIALSTAIQDWLTSSKLLELATELMKRGAMMTVLGTLVSAFAWPLTLLTATDFIDSKWSIAIDRSDKAGKLLAEELMKGMHGNRPVTLIGFSLGARVIFKCLQQLSESGDSEGLVEQVVLLGAPISLKGEQWAGTRKMVAGRFINVFSTNDWMLGITFRASLLTQGLAGIQSVDVPGVENVDVSELVDGHSTYLYYVQQIVEQLELDTCYPVFSCSPSEAEHGNHNA